ncbi:MAG: hypothetical protein LBT47_08445, partial [Deltaproteobacteria bacterium]|nr:hypothetical protein [Deltaproteobacteria bacterium]
MKGPQPQMNYVKIPRVEVKVPHPDRTVAVRVTPSESRLFVSVTTTGDCLEVRVTPRGYQVEVTVLPEDGEDFSSDRPGGPLPCPSIESGPPGPQAHPRGAVSESSFLAVEPDDVVFYRGLIEADGSGLAGQLEVRSYQNEVLEPSFAAEDSGPEALSELAPTSEQSIESEPAPAHLSEDLGQLGPLTPPPGDEAASEGAATDTLEGFSEEIKQAFSEFPGENLSDDPSLPGELMRLAEDLSAEGGVLASEPVLAEGSLDELSLESAPAQQTYWDAPNQQELEDYFQPDLPQSLTSAQPSQESQVFPEFSESQKAPETPEFPEIPETPETLGDSELPAASDFQSSEDSQEFEDVLEPQDYQAPETQETLGGLPTGSLPLVRAIDYLRAPNGAVWGEGGTGPEDSESEPGEASSSGNRLTAKQLDLISQTQALLAQLPDFVPAHRSGDDSRSATDHTDLASKLAAALGVPRSELGGLEKRGDLCGPLELPEDSSYGLQTPETDNELISEPQPEPIPGPTESESSSPEDKTSFDGASSQAESLEPTPSPDVSGDYSESGRPGVLIAQPMARATKVKNGDSLGDSNFKFKESSFLSKESKTDDAFFDDFLTKPALPLRPNAATQTEVGLGGQISDLLNKPKAVTSEHLEQSGSERSDYLEPPEDEGSAALEGSGGHAPGVFDFSSIESSAAFNDPSDQSAADLDEPSDKSAADLDEPSGQSAAVLDEPSDQSAADLD